MIPQGKHVLTVSYSLWSLKNADGFRDLFTCSSAHPSVHQGPHGWLNPLSFQMLSRLASLQILYQAFQISNSQCISINRLKWQLDTVQKYLSM